MAPLDPALCYRALAARDRRFDGRFFVGVSTTGVYCRPICPATTAARAHCRFFMSAAAAQEAGFRPCLRCRPETAPHQGAWHGTANTVWRGLEFIAAGELDADDAKLDRLAQKLGVGERHLRRLFQQHLGASPVAVAQTRRVLFAKQLIHDTRLPMSEVALASGFGSVRRFNETFRALFQRPPSALRRKSATRDARATATATAAAGVSIHLSYRPPYDWQRMLSYLRTRAIEGVEVIGVDDVYRRTFCEDGVTGIAEIAHMPERRGLTATIRFTGRAPAESPNLRGADLRVLPRIVNRIRRVFDLDADVAAIGAHLARDPLLAPLIAARPGLRLPGGWDGFEVAMRAVLGQQVSVAAARQLLCRLVRRCGIPLPSGDALAWIFPTPARVRDADLSSFGMPAARAKTLQTLARIAREQPALFQPSVTAEETVARLRLIPGVGEWTAQYIALRGAREPDALPAGDAGLRRSFFALTGGEVVPRKGAASAGAARVAGGDRALASYAERWRPWRAYAAQHLWVADSANPDLIPQEKFHVTAHG